MTGSWQDDHGVLGELATADEAAALAWARARAEVVYARAKWGSQLYAAGARNPQDLPAWPGLAAARAAAPKPDQVADRSVQHADSTSRDPERGSWMRLR
jgi:hypothetical protein